MTHDDARLLVSAVADGEAAATPELAAHLAGCAECAAYAAGVARVSTLAAALPGPVAPPALAHRLTRRIRRRRWAVRLAPALAAATAAAVVLTTLPGPGPLRLPPAAAAEPLLRLRSLYVERTIRGGGSVTYEKVWWRAPGYVRIERRTERDGGSVRSLVVETPERRYADGEVTTSVAPSIALPEPISPTVALLGTDAGPGPVVAGHPTRRYELTIDGERRTAYVADGLALGGTDTVVLQKMRGDVTKTTRVVRVNPDVADEVFAIPATARTGSALFAERPLGDLAIEPARLPQGFSVVRSGAGPDGEAYLLARGSLPVLVREGRLRDLAEHRMVPYGGRHYLVGVDLYAPPAVQVTTRAGVVTVSAPLPLASLVELAVRMYGVE